MLQPQQCCGHPGPVSAYRHYNMPISLALDLVTFPWHFYLLIYHRSMIGGWKMLRFIVSIVETWLSVECTSRCTHIHLASKYSYTLLVRVRLHCKFSLASWSVSPDPCYHDLPFQHFTPSLLIVCRMTSCHSAIFCLRFLPTLTVQLILIILLISIHLLDKFS